MKSGSDFSAEQLAAVSEAMASPRLSEIKQEYRTLVSTVESGEAPPAEIVRAGVTAHLLGLHKQADRFLELVQDSAVGSFVHGEVLVSLERFDEAAKCFAKAAKSGYDPVECKLRQVETLRRQGQIDDAESLLRSIASEAASRAEYSFQWGCLRADRGDTYGAIEYFERAVDMDSTHARALFWLAGENARRGNDDEAIRLYEQALSKPPFYLSAMINLGLLYEDHENYRAAAFCFRRVLEFDPTHPRARLFMKDIEAAGDMYYDEDTLRQEARLTQLLSRPITDFELSVRSRNCLEQMDLVTLGDLTRVSEEELLAGKNFGQTSLDEIRELIGRFGLQIGQNLHEVHRTELPDLLEARSPQEQALLDRPISELDLSVRARKCMARLGITVLSDLVRRTPDELLSSRNFGVTSLNEVREKLAELDLKLRND